MGLKGVAPGTRARTRAVLRVAGRRARVDGARARGLGGGEITRLRGDARPIGRDDGLATLDAVDARVGVATSNDGDVGVDDDGDARRRRLRVEIGEEWVRALAIDVRAVGGGGRDARRGAHADRGRGVGDEPDGAGGGHIPLGRRLPEQSSMT